MPRFRQPRAVDNKGMSQQGDRPTGRPAQEDDWWGQLYEDDAATADTGPTRAADTLDDRFASAGAVAAPPGAGPVDLPEASPAPLPGPRTPEPAQPADPPASVPPADRPDPGTDGLRPDASAAGPPPGEPPAADLPPTWGGPRRPSVPPARRPVVEPPAAEVPRPQTGSTGPWAVPQRPDVAPAGPPPTVPPVVVPPRPQTAPRGIEQDPDAEPVTVAHVGDGPPTYEPEPTALPPADPEDLDDLVADTVLDGARYGNCTLRAASVRGDSARYRGEPRRDSLLTARFGTGNDALILVAMATGARATPGAHRAAAEVCDWIGRAVGLSHARLAEDIRAGRRGDLKSGLHRLTDRSLGKLRAGAAEQGLDPDEYAATLRCLLVPADPDCRTRVFFGIGGGGLFRLRDGEWQDIEPAAAEPGGAPVVGYGSSLAAETPDGDRLTMDLGITTPPSPYEPAPEPPRDPFRFRASVARPGDTLLLCTAGLAEPLRGEPDLCRHLARRWAKGEPPGLAAFLADTQVRVKGYADDRTALGVWEA